MFHCDLFWWIFCFFLPSRASNAESICSYDGEDCPEEIDHPMQELSMENPIVRYTYSVLWKEVCQVTLLVLTRYIRDIDHSSFLRQQTDQITWSNRWDMYMTTTDPQIHWFAIINSFIILIFMTAMVAVIIMRTLNRDIAMYNEEDIEVK